MGFHNVEIHQLDHEVMVQSREDKDEWLASQTALRELPRGSAPTKVLVPSLGPSLPGSLIDNFLRWFSYFSRGCMLMLNIVSRLSFTMLLFSFALMLAQCEDRTDASSTML